MIDAAKLLEVKHRFFVGDLVEWKTGLRNKASEAPMIVTRFDLPSFSGAKPFSYNSPFFCDVSDVVCAVIDGDGYFTEYVFDSRRLQPIEKGDNND